MNYIEHLIKSLFIMASMVEARDPYTGGHLWRVSQYSRILAEYGELSTNTIARIALGGFLHDLGKISVPDAILNKAGKLTVEEYTVIKTHPEAGSRLLADHPLADLARFAVIQHHETPNGLGYPHGLNSEQISLDGRIVGICDAFDAMTSTRPYRKGMPVENALAIIQTNLGKQFHQEWGEKFIKLGEAGFLNQIVGHSETGIPLQQCPICGPTIVVSKHQQPGDHVFCRACGSEALVKKEGSSLAIEATGRHGTPSDLEPGIDNDLLNQLAQESSKYISIDATPSKSFWHWPA